MCYGSNHSLVCVQQYNENSVNACCKKKKKGGRNGGGMDDSEGTLDTFLAVKYFLEIILTL